MSCFPLLIWYFYSKDEMAKAHKQQSCFCQQLQSDDHARHSPNLVRCTQGWELKRRQAVIFGQPNGLFLTSAEHNSAICCRESLLAPHPSLWSREWANGNLRAALSSWVQDWTHMDSLLFSLRSFCLPALTFLSLSSKNTYTHSLPLSLSLWHTHTHTHWYILQTYMRVFVWN